MKRIYRTSVLTAAILTTLFICSAAVGRFDRGTSPPPKFLNLKILPHDISSKDLTKIMVDDFTDALGVSCNFCHSEDATTHRPDYASDAKPEKEMARLMMRMTLRINKQFFKLKHPELQGAGLIVTCNTCHNGRPHPDGDVK